jgi:Ni,Fe-hydrogenase I large subunit
VKLAPTDVTRNVVRGITFQHDIIPYFYGPLQFDLAVDVPKKTPDTAAEKEIKYEWTLVSSKDERTIKSDKGTMPLDSEGAFNYKKTGPGDSAKLNYYRVNGARYKTYRKKQAIYLEHVSVLDQYRVVMQFENSKGEKSEKRTMLEFTLLDRDKFSMNLISLTIGAMTGIIAAVTGFLLGNF